MNFVTFKGFESNKCTRQRRNSHGYRQFRSCNEMHLHVRRLEWKSWKGDELKWKVEVREMEAKSKRDRNGGEMGTKLKPVEDQVERTKKKKAISGS